MPVTALTSNVSVHGLPDMVRREIGPKALSQANQAAGLEFELLEGRHVFIPQTSVINFVTTTARAAGEPLLGLLMTPAMNVSDYGCWGNYLLGSKTLGQAIERSIRTLGFHSTGDRTSLQIDGDEARYSYRFALAGWDGYDQVAYVSAGVMISLCRHYVPTGWHPLRIEFDIAKPSNVSPVEDMFQCPVTFDAPAVTVVFERWRLSATAPHRRPGPSVTIEDVARFTTGGPPQDLPGILHEQLRIQVLSGSVSIDNVARAMDTSVRTLQRELNRMGTDFRTMANAKRAGRAKELLRHSDASITDIAMELGYSAPASFTRAFSKTTGMNPRQFRGVERASKRPEVATAHDASTR